MKKRIVLIIIFLLAFVLFGCSGKDDEVKLVSATLDQTTVPSEITAYDFDLSSIKLICTYSDGTTKTVALEESFFDSDNLTKLNTVGSQSIAFLYENNAYLFSVNVIKGDASLYIIKNLTFTITTTDDKYNITVTSDRRIDMYVDCKTNDDLVTATASLVVNPDFSFDSALNINCTIDGKTLEVTSPTIKNNKLSFTFDDCLWSPLA